MEGCHGAYVVKLARHLFFEAFARQLGKSAAHAAVAIVVFLIYALVR